MKNKELKLKYINYLKRGNKIPKLLWAWLKLEKAGEEWAADWKDRLLPSAHSKVLLQWTGKERPKSETAEEYTKRRIQEEQNEIDKKTKGLNKTADILHTIGVGSSLAGLGAGFVTYPLATLGGLTGGVLGGNYLDKKINESSNGKYRNWGDMVHDKLGIYHSIADLFHPGYLIGGGIGAKTVPAVGKGIDYLIRMDLPRYGFSPTTKYYFEPGYAGINGSPIKTNPIEELVTTRELFLLSPRESRPGIDIAEKAKEYETIIPFSTLDTKLGIKDSRRLFSTLGDFLGEDSYILDNGVAFKTLKEAKGVLEKLVSYLKLSNKTRAKGEPRYTEEEIRAMLNNEGTGLKEGQVLEAFYPGSHGKENWYMSAVKKDPAKDLLRRQENVRRYLRTVFGRMKREDALDLRYYNPKDRSGVLLGGDLEGLLSSDSSIMTLKHLLRELLSGRKFLLFGSSKGLELNTLGQRNSFTLNELDSNLSKMLQENPELIDKLIIKESTLSPRHMKIYDESGKKLLGILKLRNAWEVEDALNEQLKELNAEFSKYNILFNPFTSANGKIYLPDNMQGILYKKGGKV